uniref:Uncharacterized protein n=1 Tax=Rhizophora mucronata TaxID=61149 RepID=A0A2P2QQR9_RHIMU
MEPNLNIRPDCQYRQSSPTANSKKRFRWKIKD